MFTPRCVVSFSVTNSYLIAGAIPTQTCNLIIIVKPTDFLLLCVLVFRFFTFLCWLFTCLSITPVVEIIIILLNYALIIRLLIQSFLNCSISFFKIKIRLKTVNFVIICNFCVPKYFILIKCF